MSLPSPQLFSIIIPARNEEGCVASTVSHVREKLMAHSVPHEIIVVNDASTDGTRAVLNELQSTISTLRPLDNPGPHGFGFAVRYGLQHMRGDAAAIMMADESDSPDDLVRYWEKLCAGHDCVFGSRFIAGGTVTGYPLVKLVLNRIVNTAIRLLFDTRYNDTTNAFKAYRREVIDGCAPLVAADFDFTVELPLKAMVRGFSYTVIPIAWRNRRVGLAKLKIHEMGSHYAQIIALVWRERQKNQRKSSSLAA